jgi:hypothetical protein
VELIADLRQSCLKAAQRGQPPARAWKARGGVGRVAAADQDGALHLLPQALEVEPLDLVPKSVFR